MNDPINSPYPPYLYLCQAADYAPQTLRVFLLLWRDFHVEKFFQGKMYLEDEVENDHFVSWEDFMMQVRELAYIGLLEYHKTESGLCIILAQAPDIEAGGFSLC